jgi:hypothetical protein
MTENNELALTNLENDTTFFKICQGVLDKKSEKIKPLQISKESVIIVIQILGGTK